MALTQQQKTRVTIVVLFLHAVVAALTLRDLDRRGDDQIRGPRKLWKAWAVSNTTGQVAYWAVGRRP